MKKCGIGGSSGFDRLKSVKLNARNRLSVQILFFRAYSIAEFKVKKAAFINMSIMSVICNFRISIDVFCIEIQEGSLQITRNRQKIHLLRSKVHF